MKGVENSTIFQRKESTSKESESERGWNREKSEGDRNISLTCFVSWRSCKQQNRITFLKNSVLLPINPLCCAVHQRGWVAMPGALKRDSCSLLKERKMPESALHDQEMKPQLTSWKLPGSLAGSIHSVNQSLQGKTKKRGYKVHNKFLCQWQHVKCTFTQMWLLAFQAMPSLDETPERSGCSFTHRRPAATSCGSVQFYFKTVKQTKTYSLIPSFGEHSCLLAILRVRLKGMVT